MGVYYTRYLEFSPVIRPVLAHLPWPEVMQTVVEWVMIDVIHVQLAVRSYFPGLDHLPPGLVACTALGDLFGFAMVIGVFSGIVPLFARSWHSESGSMNLPQAFSAADR